MIDKQPNNDMKRPRRFIRPWRILLILLLIVIILLAGVVYSQRRMIGSLLTGSHFVGGNRDIANLHLPPGFQANVFYSGLASPRFIGFSPNGRVRCEWHNADGELDEASFVPEALRRLDDN